MLPKNIWKEVPHVGTTVGPVVGYKVLESDGPRVVSCFKRSYEWWPKRTSETADCRPALTGDRQHWVPHDRHTCGFYLFYELQRAMHDALEYKSVKNRVYDFVALVAAWGRVVHHERGCRASHMEILAVHNGPYHFRDELESLAAAMDLPFLTTKELQQFAAESGVLLHEEE